MSVAVNGEILVAVFALIYFPFYFVFIIFVPRVDIISVPLIVTV